VVFVDQVNAEGSMDAKEIERIKQGIARASAKNPGNQILRDFEVCILTVEKLKAENEHLRGPFTCKHDEKYVGGACAACHATTLEERDRYKTALEKIEWTYSEVGGYTCLTCYAPKQQGHSRNCDIGNALQRTAEGRNDAR
jgi:hypothetical protein